MINEDIIREYDLAYKRKQWFSTWRFVASGHYEWIAPYLKELHRRGAYPFAHYYLTNYYTDPNDIVIAAFVAAYFIKDDGNVLKSIERTHAYIGDSPYSSFKSRLFVHWKQGIAVILDGLYRISEQYGSILSAIMDNMKYALDPAEALHLVLKENNMPLDMVRCRLLIIRLATTGGIGLGIWNVFSPSIIMPPEDEVTKWYVSKMFPADTTFSFDELVLIMSDTPYLVIYDAMVMRLMLQADKDILNYYMWRIQKTFYSMPCRTTYVMGSMRGNEYVKYAAPVYDFATNTLVKNPEFRGSDTWLKYSDYIETEKGKQRMEEKRLEKEKNKKK